ncbi:ribbon-helix-helix protein, CopG family [Salinarimonas rosea]|uniref:ribbon-helix-helix protein, CopG family n=1 Tax=Salinarimonas rosea TaxID=552063 RepID=UPI000405C475|nr:ribbon-helix-helix protein, CopG family [Salinarimonas rosea]
MTSITVEIDDELLEKVAAHAAARGTTPDGLLRDYLEQLAKGPTDADADLEAMRRRIRELRAQSPLEVGPVTWTRESLYER